MKYLFELIAIKFKERNKFLLTGLAVCVITYIFFCFREFEQNKELEFRGIVQDVQYDIKGDVTVKINGHIYNPVSNNWSFGGQIQKGDSLIKYKNTMIIKLVKQKTGKEIVFD